MIGHDRHDLHEILRVVINQLAREGMQSQQLLPRQLDELHDASRYA
jgi:hypothetical protein